MIGEGGSVVATVGEDAAAEDAAAEDADAKVEEDVHSKQRVVHSIFQFESEELSPSEFPTGEKIVAIVVFF